MIKATNLKFKYPGGNSFHFPNFELINNENLLIKGESGIGKTTLLQLLALLLNPSSGSLIIDHTDVTQLSERKKDQFRRSHIGIIFQKPIFIQSLSLIENLQVKLYLSKTKLQPFEVNEILEDLNIIDLKHKKTNQLSEGQKQRASIALALINRPSIILADEPTASLDDKNKERVIHLLKKMAKKNKASLVLVTHDTRLMPEFKNRIAL